MIRKELKKGIHFSYKNSNQFKTSMFVINFSIPLTSKNAACYSLLTEVLKRGCNKFRTYKEISKKLVDLYASFGCYVYKKGETLCIGIYDSFLDNRYIPDNVNVFLDNIDFIHDFIFNPYFIEGFFDKDYVEQEKNNLINRIKEKINDKSSYAQRRCIEIMCDYEPYHISSTGNIEDVTSITPIDLIDAYYNLINCANVDAYYFGSLDFDFVTRDVYELLDYFPQRINSSYPKTIVESDKKDIDYTTEPIDANQGKLVIGLRTNSSLINDDFPALVLYNEILGSSPVSKLFMNVREKESLCYSCYSSLDSLKGIMLVSAGININDYQKALNAILLELQKMKNGDISDYELFSAKISLKNSYNEIKDSPFSYINWYHTRHIAEFDQSPEIFSEMIQNISIEDVIKVANNIYIDLVYFLKGTEND